MNKTLKSIIINNQQPAAPFPSIENSSLFTSWNETFSTRSFPIPFVCHSLSNDSVVVTTTVFFWTGCSLLMLGSCNKTTPINGSTGCALVNVACKITMRRILKSKLYHSKQTDQIARKIKNLLFSSYKRECTFVKYELPHTTPYGEAWAMKRTLDVISIYFQVPLQNSVSQLLIHRCALNCIIISGKWLNYQISKLSFVATNFT